MMLRRTKIVTSISGIVLLSGVIILVSENNNGNTTDTTVISVGDSTEKMLENTETSENAVTSDIENSEEVDEPSNSLNAPLENSSTNIENLSESTLPLSDSEKTGASLELTNLVVSENIAAGNSEENYENAKEARSRGDVASAISYYRSAAQSNNDDIAVIAQISIDQLKRVVDNPDSKILIEDANSYTEGKTIIAENGKFTQGSVSFDVEPGNIITVIKESYQIVITVEKKDKQKIYYSIVTF